MADRGSFPAAALAVEWRQAQVMAAEQAARAAAGPEEEATRQVIDMEYKPTRWPLSPRNVMR